MRAALLHAAALSAGVFLALTGSVLVSPGCICGPRGPELYGIPQGTFPVPPDMIPSTGPFSRILVPESVTITGSALFFDYETAEGPVEVAFTFDEPNGPVRTAP